jgi:hypothetical protein
MKRPRITKRIVESLSLICDLAQNDMEADEDRFTADDWAGINYLHKLIAWHKQKESNQ